MITIDPRSYRRATSWKKSCALRILERQVPELVHDQELPDNPEDAWAIVAIVGHDLRSPLNATMSVGMLRRAFDDWGAAPPRVLELLESSNARMKQLLDDLDDYTVTEFRGSLPVNREYVNLRAICEEVVREAQLACVHPHCEQRGRAHPR